jgi:lipase chaperone LimK
MTRALVKPAAAAATQPARSGRASRAVLVAAVAALAGTVLLAWPDDPAPEPARQAIATRPATAPAAGPHHLPPADATAELGGSPLDAARLFDLGFAGGVTLDERTRSALQVALAELPRRPSAQELERFEWRLRSGLPRHEADTVLDLLRRWRAYQADESRLLAAQPADARALDALQQRLQALRRQHFGAEVAERLFGTEEALAQHRRQVLAIEHDPALDAATRQARLSALRQALSPELRQALGEAGEPTPVQQRADALLDELRRGGDAAEVEAALRQLVGPAEAGHLLDMARQQEDWQQRQAAFTAARQAALAGVADPARRRELTDALVQAHFRAEEWPTARALAASLP